MHCISHGVNKHISISFGSEATMAKSKPETQDFQRGAGDIKWRLSTTHSFSLELGAETSSHWLTIHSTSVKPSIQKKEFHL